MPFDNTNVESDRTRVLRGALELLRDKDKWCKSNYWVEGRMCRLGAMRIAYWRMKGNGDNASWQAHNAPAPYVNDPYWKAVMLSTKTDILSSGGGEHPLVYDNDLPNTLHEHVIEWLVRDVAMSEQLDMKALAT